MSISRALTPHWGTLGWKDKKAGTPYCWTTESCYKFQRVRKPTRNRHLLWRKCLYKHLSALLSSAEHSHRDVNTNLKWRYWNALYPSAELGGDKPALPWTGVTVCITCSKGANDWRMSEQQYVKETALFPSGYHLALTDPELWSLQASFYKKWCSTPGRQRLHYTETVVSKMMLQWCKLKCHVANTGLLLNTSALQLLLGTDANENSVFKVNLNWK